MMMVMMMIVGYFALVVAYKKLRVYGELQSDTGMLHVCSDVPRHRLLGGGGSF